MKRQEGAGAFYRTTAARRPPPRPSAGRALFSRVNHLSVTTKRRTAKSPAPHAAKRERGRAAPAGRTSDHASGGPGAGSKRKVVVFLSLAGVLTLTSLLLLGLAPSQPLAPGAASSLFAVDAPQSLDVIFETAEPVEAGRWRAIYVHHSQTPAGSASSLGDGVGGVADHFVIGNGDGCADGELQIAQRWNRQQSAGRVPGVRQMDPGCVSVCLVGDFNRSQPTRTQMRRLTQLVAALQSRLGIPGSQVWVAEGVAGPGGVGRYFPAAAFRQELLP